MTRKKAYEKKIVKLIFITEGIYDLEKELIIKCPISIHGAGQNKTFIQGVKGIKIEGPKKEKKRVHMQGMTMKGSSGHGLYNENGLSFLCKDMTFTQCVFHGVVAWNTKGRLINCVITQCYMGGIICHENALIELEGSQTKVEGNGTSEGGSGLFAWGTSSIIHLLYPLTKESVSTNNHNDKNYHSWGIIQTVESFENLV